MFVISLCLVASLFFRVMITKQPDAELLVDHEFLEQVEHFRKVLEENAIKEYVKPVSDVSPLPELSPVNFDPNSVAEKDLKFMGFPPRITSNIINYRKAGGVFYRAEDLQKIYGMDSITYAMVRDYITIEKVKHLPKYLPKDSIYASSELKEKIEINHADSSELVDIKGIGPVFSSRIIKYRALLGGFYLMEQLWEVYGMDSLKFIDLSRSLYIDTTSIICMDINEYSFQDLVRHPYFTRKQVSDLLHYREFAGEIIDVEELKANQVIDSLAYEKIKPYLKCRFN